ncbi:hypothetical protein HPB52_010397 [Rhipicephalus sanguineus]|uniref:Uncharacterized protein n=1 Tax=Rhipicephalus sanguineus TaxID=34632 RepID=A0A9D4Q9J8_RHISA|nr:hypothetical protein HPB52_010397 [Rhipicephalus sanguineus]
MTSVILFPAVGWALDPRSSQRQGTDSGRTERLGTASEEAFNPQSPEQLGKDRVESSTQKVLSNWEQRTDEPNGMVLHPWDVGQGSYRTTVAASGLQA